MRSRLLIILGVVVLVGVIAFFGYKRFYLKTAEPFSAIPADAALILQFNETGKDFLSLRDSAWNAVSGRGFVARVFADLSLLDSMFNSTEDTRQFLATGMAVASIHKTSATGLDVLWVFGKSAKGAADISALIDSLHGSVSNHSFEGVRVFEKTLESGRVALARTKGLTLVSRSSFLLERAINHLHDGTSLRHDKALAPVLREMSKSDDPKIYIRFSELPEILSVSYDVPIGNANLLHGLAGWAGSDFILLGKKLLLHGVLAAAESSWLSNTGKAKTQAVDFSTVMPSSTAMFFTVKSSQFVDLDRFDKNPGLRDMFSQHFINWMGNDIALVVNEPLTSSMRDYSFLIISCDDTVMAMENLRTLVRKQADVENADPVDRRHNIYVIENFEELEPLLGMPTKTFTAPAFARFGEFIIFGNSVPSLGIYLDRLKANQTLSNDLTYLAFRDDFSSNPDVDWYFRPGLSRNVLTGLANQETVPGALLGLEPIGIQLSRLEGDLFILNGVIDVTGGAVGGPASGALAAMWRTKLDTLSTMQPVIISNLRSGEENVLIQDIDNTLYLLSKTGEILWRKDLGTPIVGAVNQVDYYRNGKLQLMFTTEKAIQLIDILGRDVSEFPIRLPAIATSGLLIADYRDQDLPRMFVACSNGNIYGYKLTGEPLPGWNPKRNVGSVPYHMEHFIRDSKDYIQITRADGSQLLLNRMGENRRPPTAKADNVLGAYVMSAGDKITFVNVTRDGKLVKIDAAGKVSTSGLIDVGTATAFAVYDLDGDGKDEVLVADTSAIYVCDLNGGRIGIIPVAGVRELFVSDDAVGAFDAQTQRAWQLVADHVDSRFPVNASAPFAVGELLGRNKPVLVVCTADGWVTSYQL